MITLLLVLLMRAAGTTRSDAPSRGAPADRRTGDRRAVPGMISGIVSEETLGDWRCALWKYTDPERYRRECV